MNLLGDYSPRLHLAILNTMMNRWPTRFLREAERNVCTIYVRGISFHRNLLDVTIRLLLAFESSLRDMSVGR